MKLEGDYLFDASVPEVWSALFDPVILAAVMPGCEKLDLVDGRFVGEIKVKVGPIQGKFAGKVELKDKAEPTSYTMIVDGTGAPGFVKATVAVRLAGEDARTRVFYDADAQIGGKIASVGQRLIEASARAIVAQSLEGLHTNIKLRAAAYRAAAAASPATDAAAPTEALAVEPPAADAPAAPDPSTAATLDPAAAPASPPAADQAAAPAAKPVAAAPTEPEAAPLPPAPVAEVPAAPAARPAPVVAFTPVKVTQGQLANAVAKEVASSVFSRQVLVAIIAIQFVIILWLLLR